MSCQSAPGCRPICPLYCQALLSALQCYRMVALYSSFSNFFIGFYEFGKDTGAP
ncbi:unnamed protein product [Staurois parvus]|uniref:Uncharacterized protein n=1 Tax=Staurois parvus TaxID=386267 RepID=A0ABN9CBF4_9NEOB|nr:unnamed protein product [Staurois parvus]